MKLQISLALLAAVANAKPLAARQAVPFSGTGHLIIYQYDSDIRVGCATQHGLWASPELPCAKFTSDIGNSIGFGTVNSSAGVCGYGVTSLGYGFSCGLVQSEGVDTWNTRTDGDNLVRLDYQNYYGSFGQGATVTLDGGKHTTFLTADYTPNENYTNVYEIGWESL